VLLFGIVENLFFFPLTEGICLPFHLYIDLITFSLSDASALRVKCLERGLLWLNNLFSSSSNVWILRLLITSRFIERFILKFIF